jgi:hypothetical protein
MALASQSNMAVVGVLRYAANPEHLWLFERSLPDPLRLHGQRHVLTKAADVHQVQVAGLPEGKHCSKCCW